MPALPVDLQNSVTNEIERLRNLIVSTQSLSITDRLNFFKNDEFVKKSIHLPIYGHFSSDLFDQEIFFVMAALGQASTVFRLTPHLSPPEVQKRLNKTIEQLKTVHNFYKDLGGILGYHLAVLELIEKKRGGHKRSEHISYERPPRFDFCVESEVTADYILEGMKALESLGELYPIGGLGDRLNLVDELNQPLPAACLKFEGRTLLEGLIRDIQAREYLYYKVFGKQLTVPVALMTSFEKGNHRIISSICEENKWFGRPQESFKLFSQPSVPVITEDGDWSMLGELELNLKPGGHGVVWKLADEAGVISWFFEKNKTKLLVRQINNPIAGTDYGLLAFVGIGYKHHKTLGLASCPRLIHAAEGVLVLKKERIGQELRASFSNIEYTDFETHGIQDVADEGQEKEGHSRYPANTNILYMDLEQFLPLSRKIHQKGFLPGPLINMKNRDLYIDAQGLKSEKLAGRLETMMQSVSDWITTNSTQDPLVDLKTYVTFNERRKTISVTKRSYEPHKPLMETPEGCFYDLTTNAIHLLRSCGFECPNVYSELEYKALGPSCIFRYHPALGPLYSLIRQKLRGGTLGLHSELILELAEVDIENLHIHGSLIIKSNAPLGHSLHNIVHYSSSSSRCRFKNVRIENRGYQFTSLESCWKDQLKREECVHIVMGENSELVAEDIIIKGSLSLTIPPNERWTLQKGAQGTIEILKEKISTPSWQWDYFIKDNRLIISIN